MTQKLVKSKHCYWYLARYFFNTLSAEWKFGDGDAEDKLDTCITITMPWFPCVRNFVKQEISDTHHRGYHKAIFAFLKSEKLSVVSDIYEHVQASSK